MDHDDPRSVWLRIAAVALAGAGLVHAAAAGQHADHRALAVGFAVVAAAQIGGAAVTLLRSRRSAASVALVLAVVPTVCWAVTRLVAVPAINGLDTVQPVGTQDVVAVVLQVLTVAAGIAALARVRVRPALVPVAAVLSIAFAVPAAASPHRHDDGHAADHHGGITLAAAETAAGGDTHAEGHTDDHADDHADEGHTTTPAAGAGSASSTPAHSHDATPTTAASGPPVTVTNPGGNSEAPDRPPTREELARANALIDATVAALAAYRTTADVEAAGYRSIGDARTGFEHFVHAEYLVDGIELDPARVESIVFKVNPDRTKTIASGMYILTTGKTLADVPNVGGPLTVWHDHQNLCWDGDGKVVGLLVNGSCLPRGTFRPTAPMLHVWVTEHPCGPFAGIEGTGPLAAALGSHGEGCKHTH